MRVSVIIPTRDRPDDLARCLPTILANKYPDFEVIVVDQSTGDASERVVSNIGDARLRYHRQHVSGKARALNVGLAQAKGGIIALTDDDCTVPSDWLRRAISVLAEEPEAGIVFGALAAVPHDPRETYIPEFLPPCRRRLQGPSVGGLGVGVGANMVVRRAVFEGLGGFDECLGPGSRFRSGDEWDFSHRALRAGFVVVQDPENGVVHWGRRNYANGSAQQLRRNKYYGIGGGLAKHLRCGDPLAAYTFLQWAFREVTLLFANVIKRRSLTGAGRLTYLFLGFIRGFRQPVDHQRWLFRPTGDERP